MPAMERISAAAFRQRLRLPPPGHEDTPHPALPPAKPTQPARALDRDDAGEAPRTERPLVRIVMFRVRLLDADAKHGACKNIVDGLQYAGAIRGDKEDQVNLIVEQVRVPHYCEERTEVVIDYGEENSTAMEAAK